jgi:ABC-type Fe3+ transport system permease subunit
MLTTRPTPTLGDQGISPSLSDISLNTYLARMALPGTKLAPAWLLAFNDAGKHQRTAYYAFNKVDMALRV